LLLFIRRKRANYRRYNRRDLSGICPNGFFNRCCQALGACRRNADAGRKQHRDFRIVLSFNDFDFYQHRTTDFSVDGVKYFHLAYG
jgi:hypothetical protein